MIMHCPKHPLEPLVDKRCHDCDTHCRLCRGRKTHWYPDHRGWVCVQCHCKRCGRRKYRGHCTHCSSSSFSSKPSWDQLIEDYRPPRRLTFDLSRFFSPDDA